jgi:hypothetical protein
VSIQGKRLRRQDAPAGGGKFVPKVAGGASPKSVGHAAAPPLPLDPQLFRWTAVSVDHAFSGAWDWDLRGREAQHVLTVLQEMSDLTWREVKALETHSKRQTHRLHHSQPVDSVCRDAQQRLDELELQVQELFRLRHGNLVRIWGYVQGATFHILWFDRDHSVCPSEQA